MDFNVANLIVSANIILASGTRQYLPEKKIGQQFYLFFSNATVQLTSIFSYQAKYNSTSVSNSAMAKVQSVKC